MRVAVKTPNLTMVVQSPRRMRDALFRKVRSGLMLQTSSQHALLVRWLVQLYWPPPPKSHNHAQSRRPRPRNPHRQRPNPPSFVLLIGTNILGSVIRQTSMQLITSPLRRGARSRVKCSQQCLVLLTKDPSPRSTMLRRTHTCHDSVAMGRHVGLASRSLAGTRTLLHDISNGRGLMEAPHV